MKTNLLTAALLLLVAGLFAKTAHAENSKKDIQKFYKGHLVIQSGSRVLENGTYILKQKEICSKDILIPIFEKTITDIDLTRANTNVVCESELMGVKVYAVVSPFSLEQQIPDLPAGETNDFMVRNFRKYQNQRIRTIGGNLVVSIYKEVTGPRTLTPQESADYAKIGKYLPMPANSFVSLVGVEKGLVMLFIDEPYRSCYSTETSSFDPICEARERFSAQLFIENDK
jgi:hypothetical protein